MIKIKISLHGNSGSIVIYSLVTVCFGNHLGVNQINKRKSLWTVSVWCILGIVRLKKIDTHEDKHFWKPESYSNQACYELLL